MKVWGEKKRKKLTVLSNACFNKTGGSLGEKVHPRQQRMHQEKKKQAMIKS
jgi:hypothetical protein